jgi:predicted ATPase
MQAKTTHLQPERTRFIGRAADLAAVAALFSAGARLVTVTGPPGVGKTRLALEYLGSVRQQSAAAFPPSRREAWFCDLSSATDVHGICAALGSTLDVRLTSDTALHAVQQLGRALDARGPSLLVLDNFEQVASCAPETLARWLDLCPRALFLVTSREMLNLPEARAYELPPMSLPTLDEDAPASEAVQLFVERAQRVRPGFQLTPADLPSIAHVVRELDGMPLAIELAASRMGILTVHQLKTRLPARFELLATTGRHPHGPDRQHTLENAIHWSWRLLAPREQSALARCSVFRGGFSLEAAEAILGPEMPALDVLQSLRERSLLTSHEPPDLPGESRFSLLHSVREYAARRLEEQGDRALAESRHTAHFLEAGERLAAQLDARPELSTLRRIQLELDNLTAVLQRALLASPPSAASAEIALRTLLVLDPVLTLRGPFGRHVEWLEAALSLPVAGSPSLWARALVCRASVYRTEGKLGNARRDFTDALLLARQVGDRHTEGRAHDGLGALSVLFGQIPDARDHYEAALAIFRDIGARPGEGQVLAHLGTLHRLQGAHAAAADSYERGLRLLRESGDQRSLCKVLLSLSSVAVESGQIDQALSRCHEALQLAQALGDSRAEDMVRRHLGDILLVEGHLDQAEAHYQRSLVLMRQTGNRRLEGLVVGAIGVVRMEQHRFAEALGLFDQAVQLHADSGDRFHAGIFQGLRSAALAGLDRVDESAASFEEAERVLGEIGAHMSIREARLYQAYLDLARARKALREGDREKAVAYRDEALRRLADAEAPAQDQLSPHGAGSFTSASARARIGLRMIRASPWPALAEPPAPPAEGSSLEADPSGEWFRFPSTAQAVSFARRKNLRRVFARLLEARSAQPGRPLAVPDLLEAGWPGEKVLPEAGANRVYVALATLRKMGLKDVLRSNDSGYFLDPAVPVHLTTHGVKNLRQV